MMIEIRKHRDGPIKLWAHVVSTSQSATIQEHQIKWLRNRLNDFLEGKTDRVEFEVESDPFDW